MKILLDYFFPITSISPVPAASTAFLKQVLVVVKPKGGVTPGTITQVTSNSGIAALTDNTEAQQLLNAGLTRAFILPMDDLDLTEALEGHESDFNTILISSDFTDAEFSETKASGTFTISSYANLVSGTDDVLSVAGVAFTAQAGAATPGTATFQAATSNDATAASLAAQINAHATASALVSAVAVGAVVTITALNAGSNGNAIALVYTDNDTNVGAARSGATLTGGDGFFAGAFAGVVGLYTNDKAFAATQAAIEKRVAFYATTSTKAKNMFYAFGKLLGNPTSWLNQQYITVPYADDVDSLGDAENLFDDKVSFVISDDEFGHRLALFAAGGKAIVEPYVIKDLEVRLKSKALTYISGNMPNYTNTDAVLLEDELQKVVDLFVDAKSIESGTVEVKLEEENFVASSYINVSEPKALWRVRGKIKQTL